MDIVVSPVLIATYIYWLWTVFSLMKSLRNNHKLNLHSENAKLKWQTLYYVGSLICFFVCRLFVLIGVESDLYTTITIQMGMVLVIDIPPVCYMAYVHFRMFRRQQLTFNTNTST